MTDSSIFYPAPVGLPVPVRPREGKSELRRLLLAADFGPVASGRRPQGVRAGALWVHGFIDDAHKIAQDDPSIEGSYWHALVHRSEGDFDNSMYWFGRVGQHPIFSDLRSRVEQIAAQASEGSSADILRSLLASRQWEPGRFVQLCREARAGENRDLNLLRLIAANEYNLLMAYCLSE